MAKVTGVKRIWGIFKVAEVEVTVPGPLKKSTERKLEEDGWRITEPQPQEPKKPKK